MEGSLLPSVEESGGQLAELGEGILACLAQSASGGGLFAA
jgi:hypothetical protein